MTKPKQPKIDRSGPGIAQEAPEAATVTSEPSNGSGRLRLEWRSPAELAENPRNWRTHPESQQAALAGVLSEVGWAGACLYNERTGRLIDGHLRRKVAQMQGAETLPVLVGDWSEADEAKILATLDPIAGLAECDPVRLRSVIDDVQTATQEVADLLTRMWEDNKPVDEAPADPVDADPQTDRAAELQAKWGTAAGQLWLLGKHRLLVGDSTKPEDVARVMGGEKVDCVLTDPPYGINREGIENDDPEGLLDLFSACMACSPMDNGVAVAFQSPRLFHVWLEATRKAGHKFERMLWMHKQNDVTHPWRGWMMNGEAILVSSIGKPKWGDAKAVQDCYTINHDVAEKIPHTSVKPLGVVADIAAHLTGTIYDPFLGSGTTLIAAENLGRRCFGLEISPGYCAVILQRYADAFPDQEIKLNG